MEYVNQAAREIATATGIPHALINQAALEILTNLTPAPLPWIPDGGARVSGADSADPQIWQQTSDDGGRTWSSERYESLGKLGEYGHLVCWRRNGRSNNRAFRVICTAAVRVAFIACDLDSA